jgi:hypothetical protein
LIILNGAQPRFLPKDQTSHAAVFMGCTRAAHVIEPNRVFHSARLVVFNAGAICPLMDSKSLSTEIFHFQHERQMIQTPLII